MKAQDITQEMGDKWADRIEAGLDLSNGWKPGPYAWLLDIVSDWDAFSARVAAENTTPEDLTRKALDAYLAS